MVSRNLGTSEIFTHCQYSKYFEKCLLKVWILVFVPFVDKVSMEVQSSFKLAQEVLVILGCTSNILSAVTIIFLNKYIFINCRIQTMTLTAIQMGVTWIGLLFFWQLGILNVRSVRLQHMVPVAVVFCGFIVFSNLSLEYNTIGTYQLYKGLTTPVLALISWRWYNTKYSITVIASIVSVVVGVYTHSVNDIKLSLFGTVLASVGVVSAALYQLWIGIKLKELNMNPQQLLFYQAPLSVSILIPYIVLYEKVPKYVSFEEQQQAVLALMLSAVIGFVLNVTTYWIIKHT